MRLNSLAFRLIFSAAGWSIIVLVLTGLVLSSLFKDSLERNFDKRLEAYLTGLIANTELDENARPIQARALGETRFDIPLSGLYWQITRLGPSDPDALTSASLLDFKLALPRQAGAAPGEDALRRGLAEGPEGQSLRIIEREISLPGSREPFSVAVGGDTAEIATEVSTFNNTLLLTLSILALGLVSATFIQVRFGLKPLRDMRRALTRIREGKLDRLTGDYPVEIDPVADELNALLRANQDVVERARVHVGNLAHALKTPLSVITNEAQARHGPLARKIGEQAGLMGDQINLYLDRARMAAGARVLGVVTEVEPVADRVVRAVRRIYSDRDITVDVSIEPDLRFRGERQDLEELVGNLVDNACKWAKANVSFTARALADEPDGPSRLEIIVDDDGPGLPPDRRAEVLKRGKRLDETKPGSGLGLAIVSELVGAYDGTVELSAAPEGGLRVRLVLPAIAG